jgi:hypothetical protein
MRYFCFGNPISGILCLILPTEGVAKSTSRALVEGSFDFAQDRDFVIACGEQNQRRSFIWACNYSRAQATTLHAPHKTSVRNEDY